jgi:hypothetical protein
MEDVWDQMTEEPLFLLNRVVVVVLPKAPFVQWINRVKLGSQATVTLDAARADPTTFLIPVDSDEFDAPGERWLHRHWGTLFERLLRDWSDDEQAWPFMRTHETFEQWCEIQRYSVVFDCSAQALEYGLS